MTGRFILKLKGRVSEASIRAIARKLGTTIAERRESPSGVLLLLTPIPGAMAHPSSFTHPSIQYVESETTMHAQIERARGQASGVQFEGDEGRAPARLLQAVAPNDPYFSYQWNLKGYPFGANLIPARGIASGRGVTVAVLDTGVRKSLDDLAGILWAPGWSALDKSGNTDDRNGHGSHVTGTICETTDNQRGCAGIAPGVTLMPVRVLDETGSGSNFGIASGIVWAVDHGATVLNMSLGGAASRTLEEAVRYAVNKGVTVVASAGNAGVRGLTYPAAYAEVISVGAATKTGGRASFSQYGAGLTLLAPGVSILQQSFSRNTGRSGYFYFSGTSMAAPHVTGACALLRSLSPGLSALQIRKALTGACRDRGPPGEDPEYGAGLLDIAGAVAAVGGYPPPAPLPIPAPEPAPGPGSSDVSLALSLLNGERAKAGAPAVVLEARLTRAAKKHADELSTRGLLSHTGLDGSSPGDRISREGYRYRTYGEVIAAGQQTPEAVIRAWMNSPGHHAIMMDARYQEVGIAVTRRAGNPYGIFWVMDFASP